MTDSGWNLHLYNPPTAHNLAPAIQISVAYPASRISVPTYSFYCLHTRHILLYQGPPNR